MGQRIRQLEDALSLLQPSHPLLRDEYLRIKFPPNAPEDTAVEKEVSTEVADLADEYGTLTLEEGGRTRYFGRTGVSESLMGGEASYFAGSEPQSADSHVPPEIKRLSRFFMDGPQSDSLSLDVMIGYLPDNTHARSLCEVYLTQALWSPRLVMRDELIDDILTPVYAYIESSFHEANLSLVEESIPLSPHRLAVLFLVLAIGTLLDSSIPPYNIKARDFFDLGKACLSLDDILESSEPATLQALCLTGYFLNQGGPWHSPEAPWCIKGLCTSLVYRLGLHSESPDWNLDPKTRNRRRTLFWEVVYLDVFYSLTLGRPPALNVSFMNCPFPDEPTEPTEAEVQKGVTEPNFVTPRRQLPHALSVLLWGWKFCKEVVSQIAITTLTPQIPDYATILDLDKKIREHGVPPDVKANSPSLYSRGVRLSATSWVTSYHSHGPCSSLKIASIYIHRSFFLKAIKDYPHDPLRSPHASSFLAAYNGASTVIQLDSSAVSQEPSWLSRRWGAFNSRGSTRVFFATPPLTDFHTSTAIDPVLSAGVIVGLIVARCPTHGMAQKAFDDLTTLVDMFSGISDTSSRARAAHDALNRLRDRAIRTLDKAHGQEAADRGGSETHDSGATSEDDDWEIFAGRTKMRMGNSRGRKFYREERSSTSVSPGQAVGATFSSFPSEGIPATHAGDSYASSSFPTAGWEHEPGFQFQEHQDYHQVSAIHPHREAEGQPRHQSGVEDTLYPGWERQPPPHGIPSPPTSSMMGGGMNAQWFTLMQEEGLIDPYGNLNTHQSS
ncbi:hypothetical protein AAF712_000129 [Marasmius tenuissimus]|uniref:Xylanolytic transcriptional activator regulatory domain-containing protein n=1 Tax=Marasmius tenuissimus TaxID=585030 RepID=A0ABR3AEK8_9AGAR